MTADKNDSSRIPLYVDLDGTLVATDTLIVSVRWLFINKPWTVLLLPFLLWGGRAAFKHRIARRVTSDFGDLPYRSDVLNYLRAEKNAGRTLILATAAHREIAVRVAHHVNMFDGIIASDRRNNLKGMAKLRAIRDHAGSDNFAYMGDSMADLPIFRSARESYLVYPTRRLLSQVRDSCQIARIFQ